MPGFTRGQLVRHLEAHRIETRFLFAGNILNSAGLRANSAPRHRRIAQCRDGVSQHVLCGCVSGFMEAHIGYMRETVDQFFEALKRA